jgi:hypothetical protein
LRIRERVETRNVEEELVAEDQSWFEDEGRAERRKERSKIREWLKISKTVKAREITTMQQLVEICETARGGEWRK